ncbi:UNKNOWN [Stylonychia lemnae]|uniref:RCC1-like domain-containing protein n=1 Tax=Stylonychia lemnae TaxID=5949 RepID=A0A078AMF3_STYLE|nr:UNKNOWN [Stylonychia lemnae]|eukprot:CDW82033.1 UNKNOWN [Stylonychia lemnae]
MIGSGSKHVSSSSVAQPRFMNSKLASPPPFSPSKRNVPQQQQQNLSQKVQLKRSKRTEKENDNDYTKQTHQEQEINTVLYAWGSDSHGQLGIQGKRKNYLTPKQCQFGIVVSKISCGFDHTAIITSNLLIFDYSIVDQGNLYMMGSNNEGKLGLNEKSIQSILSPQLVDTLLHSQIASVSCGDQHTVAVSSTGECYSWGQGTNGALGIGQVIQRFKPTQIEELKGQVIIDVQCGAKHTLLMNVNHEILSCGNGMNGQLGLGVSRNELFPKKIIFPNQATKIVCFSAGNYHSLFLEQNGEVFGCGSNDQGQLGIADIQYTLTPQKIPNLQNVTQISCFDSSMAVNQMGQVLIWGPSLVDQSFSHHIQPVTSIPNQALKIRMGRTMGVIMDNQKMVWVFGANKRGDLGVGDYGKRLHPYPLVNLQEKNVTDIQIGNNYAIAITEFMLEERKSEKKQTQQNKPSQQTNQVIMKDSLASSSIMTNNGQDNCSTINVNNGHQNSNFYTYSSQNQQEIERQIHDFKSQRQIELIKKDVDRLTKQQKNQNDYIGSLENEMHRKNHMIEELQYQIQQFQASQSQSQVTMQQQQQQFQSNSQHNPFHQNMLQQQQYSPQFLDTKLQSQDLNQQLHMSGQPSQQSNQLFTESNNEQPNKDKQSNKIKAMKDKINELQQQLNYTKQLEEKERELRFETQQKLVELEEQYQAQQEINLETKREIDQMVQEIQQLQTDYKAKEDDLSNRLDDAFQQLQSNKQIMDEHRLQLDIFAKNNEELKMELRRQDEINQILQKENTDLLNQIQKFSHSESLQLSQLTIGNNQLKTDSRGRQTPIISQLFNQNLQNSGGGSNENLQKSRIFKSPMPFNLDKSSKSLNTSPMLGQINTFEPQILNRNPSKKPFDYNVQQQQMYLNQGIGYTENSMFAQNTENRIDSRQSRQSQRQMLEEYNLRLLKSIERKAKKIQTGTDDFSQADGADSRAVSPKSIKINEIYKQYEDAKSPPRVESFKDKYSNFSDIKNKLLSSSKLGPDDRNTKLRSETNQSKIQVNLERPSSSQMSNNKDRFNTQQELMDKQIFQRLNMMGMGAENGKHQKFSMESDISGYQFLTQSEKFSSNRNLISHNQDQHQTFHPTQGNDELSQNFS